MIDFGCVGALRAHSFVVYQQMRRWLKAKVFEALVRDLRDALGIAEVVEQSFGWMSRFRRLMRDNERLTEILRRF